MPKKKPEPEIEIKEIPNKVLSFLWNWFQKKKLVYRIFFIVLVTLVLFFVARLGFLGKSMEKLTYNIYEGKIFPTDKSYIDSSENTDPISQEEDLEKSDLGTSDSIPVSNKVKKRTVENLNSTKGIIKRINLSLNFLVNDKQGLLNRTYLSGDEISVIFGSSSPSNILLISIDNDTIIDLLENNFNSHFIDSANKEIIKFVLDSNRGEEIIILLASVNELNYNNDVRKSIEEVIIRKHKGPNLSNKLAFSRNDIFYKTIYFNHR